MRFVVGEAHKALVPAGLHPLQRVPILASGEDLGAEPASVGSPAIVAAPELDVSAVVLQQGKIPVVEEAGCVIVLSLLFSRLSFLGFDILICDVRLIVACWKRSFQRFNPAEE